MTVQTNAFLTYDAIGNRENLSEVISNLSPEETPFTSAIGSTEAGGILYEWQTDALAAADSDNAVLEGDVVDGTASSPTTREKNYCQISRRDVVVSSTQETVKKAGRSTEMGYQIAKRLKELKRDIEAVVIGNQGYNAGASGTARRTRSIESFLVTNTDRDTGGGGADAAAATDAATDSSGTRAFTESMLKGVIQSCYTEGASPSILSVGPFNKGVVSGFTGRSQARQAIADDRIQAAAHLYASDFGEIKVTPNRFQRERTALVIDPEYAEIAYLRAPQVKDLARTGDSERKYVVAEYALCVKNEKAHGMMAAIKSWWDECLGGINLSSTDTGAADAYVLTPAPAITAYVAGQMFSFFAANANTGASTVAVNGLATKAIEFQGSALTGGEIASGDLVTLIYDGTAFRMLSLPTTVPSLTLKGDLTVDTDTLHVDSANDRVGIGTTTPSQTFHVFSTAALTSLLESSGSADVGLRWKEASQEWNVKLASSSGSMIFRDITGAADLLELDTSGNLDVKGGNLELAGSAALPVDQLTEIDANDLDQENDSLLVYDASASAHKQIKAEALGVKLVSSDAAQTFALADANTMQIHTGSTARTWTIPANASVAFALGTVIEIYQSGSGQITIDGTSVTLRSPNGTKTAQQYAVAALTKVGSDEWVLYGDVTT